MKFVGPSLVLTNSMFPEDRLSEVMVLQQHCGGSTLCVFRELLPPNSKLCYWLIQAVSLVPKECEHLGRCHTLNKNSYILFACFCVVVFLILLFFFAFFLWWHCTCILSVKDNIFYYTHFEIIYGPCRLALIDAIYSRIAPFFALNRIFFPANEEATLKTKQPIRYQDFLKVTAQIEGKWETKSIIWQILQLLLTKFSPPPPKKKKFRPAKYCINKIFDLTKSCIWAIWKWME